MTYLIIILALALLTASILFGIGIRLMWALGVIERDLDALERQLSIYRRINQTPSAPEPLNREPLNREPLNREPLNREPLNREPLNREPLNPDL